MEYEPVRSDKYPMIGLSLYEARCYELDFINRRTVMFERNSSFVNLFRRRMRRNGNGWETVSVTIDVVIKDDRAPLEKQEKTKLLDHLKRVNQEAYKDVIFTSF